MTDDHGVPLRLTADEAATLARERFGVAPDSVRELGSNEDQNLLVEASDGRRYVLKITHPDTPLAAIEAQNAAMRHVGELVGMDSPRAHLATDGRDIVTLPNGGNVRYVRLLDFVEGSSPVRHPVLHPGTAWDVGRAAGALTAALSDFDHAGLDGYGDWDLRSARRVVEEAVPLMSAADRERIPQIMRDALARLAPHEAQLRVQAVHGDLTTDNVVTDDAGKVGGVIDFGDLGYGWAVGELAIAVSSLLHHDGDVIPDALDAIEAFDREFPLNEHEIAAIWPLVVLRATVLIAGAVRVKAEDPDNEYASARRPLERRILERAVGLPFDNAELLIRQELSAPPAEPTWTVMIDGLAHAPKLDLSVTSPVHDGGAWLVAGAWRESAPIPSVTRYAESRLVPEAALAAQPRSVAMGVDAFVPEGTPVRAPADAVVAEAGDQLVLRLDAGERVIVGGVAAEVAVGERVAAGRRLGRSVGSVWVQRCTVDGPVPPRMAPEPGALRWERICPDPGPLLGRAPRVPRRKPPSALLRARLAHVAGVQEHYYADPPEFERGWRHHLIDTTGRGYLDMVNNVAILGHGEPRIAQAVERQLHLLNTNSRFHYEALAAFSRALAERAPEGLDQVLLVNSGSEAVDLAIRMARAATGRRDVLALEEAYHGWTVGADAISTSLGDNPAALGTRPEWVHLLPAPNTYRGMHRGADAPLYASHAVARLEVLDNEGVSLAGFVAEPIFGNGGGILLPEGYLATVYEAVRARGGVCVSDEVQVGYGRLGAHFWGFEQQGVVPDIIAVAKAMGNGHPLGAVITTREIAEAFAAEGSFFSSAGGSPVSCVVGSTVLRVLEEDGLQQNARVVGEELRAGLLALCERHPALGAVHGMGLYLGVEVVRDGPDTPDPVAAREICETMLAQGVIVQPTGDHKNVLKIKPPLTIDSAAVERFLAALDTVITLREARARL